MSVEILQGDCIDVMATLDADSFHACVTDPPYHFGSIVKRFAKSGGADRPESRVGAYSRHARGFMGKEWDGGTMALEPETWAAVLRVLKPGAHLAAFGGTKTFHRMACAIEDAGFELRDTLMWVYGSGFPKSHNQHGDWEGWGTALKPAWEPIILARKPLVGTVAQNLAKHRTGAINIVDCRVGDEVRHAAYTSLAPCHGNALGKSGTASARRGTQGEPKEYVGRWPANLLHDGSDEAVEAFPVAPGQIADASNNSERRKTQNTYGAMKRGSQEASAERRYTDKGSTNFAMKPGARREDEGSAARFFYCAKASKQDREDGNTHPTVKPTALMRWLCKLVTPPRGVILDPFMGSGSTGKAALFDEFRFVGIEREAEYVEIARRRLGLAAVLETESAEALLA